MGVRAMAQTKILTTAGLGCEKLCSLHFYFPSKIHLCHDIHIVDLGELPTRNFRVYFPMAIHFESIFEKNVHFEFIFEKNQILSILDKV